MHALLEELWLLLYSTLELALFSDFGMMYVSFKDTLSPVGVIHQLYGIVLLDYF